MIHRTFPSVQFFLELMPAAGEAGLTWVSGETYGSSHDPAKDGGGCFTCAFAVRIVRTLVQKHACPVIFLPFPSLRGWGRRVESW